MGIENIYRNFNRIFFTNSLFLITLVHLISVFNYEADKREKIEQLATLVPLFVVLAALFSTLRIKIPTRPALILDLFIGLIVISEILVFTAIKRPFGDIPKAWSGYGRSYAVVLVLYLGGVFFLPQLKLTFSPRTYQVVKRAIGLLSVFIVALYIPSLIQMPK